MRSIRGLLFLAGVGLTGCVPFYGTYLPAPKGFRGDLMVNAYGATLATCDIGPGFWSGENWTTCIYPGHATCEDLKTCLLVPAWTPVRVLHSFSSIGSANEDDVTLWVGTDAKGKVAHAHGRGWNILQRVLVRPGERQPAAIVTAQILCAGTVAESKHGRFFVVPEHWEPYVVVADRNFLPDRTSAPARLASGMGVQVQVDGPPRGVWVVLRTRVTHPPMTNPDTAATSTTEAWDWSILPGNQKYTGWVFDKPWELVPGSWKIEILEGERLIATQQFSVSAPGDD